MNRKATQTILCPKSLNFDGVFEFTSKIQKLQPIDEYIFDFSNLSWIEPFALLIVSSEISMLVARCSGTKFSAVIPDNPSAAIAYAGYMGFFGSFGVDFGNQPGDARVTQQYVPMILFNCDTIRAEAVDSGRAVGSVVENTSQELARSLVQADKGALFETLAYSLREIMRNVVEHSQSKQFGCCAQFWPQRNLVELALLDRGVGIKQTLSQNPRLEISSEIDALKFALLPGISGAHIYGYQLDDNDPWGNSGYGLYMTSSLCKRGGSFFISSGNAGLKLKGKTKKEFNKQFHGTALRLVLNTKKISELRETLGRLQKEGETIAATMNATGHVSASMASLHLSKDFTD